MAHAFKYFAHVYVGIGVLRVKERKNKIAMKDADRREILPLLGVLKSLPSPQRVIVLAHLDNKTRDKVYECVHLTLQDRSALPHESKNRLRRRLWKEREDWRCLSCKRSPKALKRQKLLQLGGAPMGFLLKSMVPLMLRLYK